MGMTQSGDPLENAIAERANGIIKTEWLYKMKIKTIKISDYLLSIVLQKKPLKYMKEGMIKNIC